MESILFLSMLELYFFLVTYINMHVIFDWTLALIIPENRDRALGLSEMYQAISQLPQANKDTLAFLILHLLR